ncbi:MAG: hypothetical protein M1830_005527 [Pleopsidium flavum]|nr:MAG: hypothetical protein M1830_005527 [Pleopsidium flavum]
MNRFRSRKKARDAAEEAGGSMSNADGAFLASFSTKSFRKGKKGQGEPRREVDLSTALPSSDDFRTSLLMPNLSARFSMLREQDDPTSKLGKANDDSVLFPKRASRLNLFSHNGLSDISEVASIDSIRPPFAYRRADSNHSGDGYGTDDSSSHNGSVMSRSKHREGNNLFGGRQKIYKIAVGSSALAKDLGSATESVNHGSGRRMGGRALYGDDVSSSAFQKLWEKEQEEQNRRERKEVAKDDVEDTRTDDLPTSSSPPGYNRSRETSSSTASGPSILRTSTAATSVASQSVISLPGSCGNANNTTGLPISQQPQPNPVGLDRGFTKSRRLYGQGLDQHMLDQQSSAMHKLDSLQQRAPGSGLPPNLLQSQSAFNLRDHYQRPGPLYALPATRAVSPPPSAVSRGPVALDLGAGDHMSIDSNGHSGHGVPLSPPMSEEDDSSVFSSAVQPNDRGKATALGAFNKPSMPYDEQQYSKRQVQLHQARGMAPPGRVSPSQASDAKPQAVGPSLNGPNTGTQARSETPSQRPEPSFPVTITKCVNDMHPTSNGTFLAQSSDSEESSDTGSETGKDTNSSPVKTPQLRSPSVNGDEPVLKQHFDGANDHPAHAQAALQWLYMGLTNDDSPERPITDRRAHLGDDSSPGKVLSDNTDADSPTLGPTSGLSGLVRAHLRNDSGQSSIYPAPSPGVASQLSPQRSSSEPVASASLSAEHSGDTRSNAWDMNDSDDGCYGKPDLAPAEAEVPVAPPLSIRAKQILGQAAALRDQERLRAQQASREDKVQVQGQETKNSERKESWQEEIRGRHQRAGSTETQKEREDFAHELARRRRRVEENIKSYAENQSRSGSPVRGRNHIGSSPTKTGHAMGPFKPRPNKDFLAGKQDSSSKAMKMLGMGGTGPSGRPHRPSQRDYRKEDEDRMLRNIVKGPKVPHNQLSAPFQNLNGVQPMQGLRERKHSVEDRDRSNRPGLSPQSSESSRREPSSSDISGERFRSHSGRDREIRQVNADDAGSSPTASHAEAPLSDESSSPHRTSPDVMESKITSPVMLHSASHTPPNYDNSPNTSTSTSPTTVPFNGLQTSGRIPSNRKKTINKSDISEPTFLSCTSSVNTVKLPAGAGSSSRNEATFRGPAPPLPPINPRRRTPQQTSINALGKGDKADAPPMLSTSISFEQGRRTLAKEGEQRRQRLRKSSSEGGNLNARARHLALMVPSPTLPQSVHKNGGMF